MVIILKSKIATLGYESKTEVGKYIHEIYNIAHRIAPINKSGNNSINKDWKDIYRMANLSNAITRDFNSCCHEIEILRLELIEKKLKIDNIRFEL